jgi:ABC-type uncharacterized transport system substrate-binding protein
MNKHCFYFVLSALLFALCFSASAQQPANVPRVGYLSNRIKPTTAMPDRFEDAFRQALRDLGYIEGKNILVEYRYAEGMGGLIPDLVAELIQLKVDVIVSTTIRGIRAAKQATKTIPIVMVTTADPVAAGLVDGLARPGGNITGLTRLTRELSGKRLELLKEVVPEISRVGVLWNASSQATESGVKSYEAAARTLKLHILSLKLSAPEPNLQAAFEVAAKERANALITPTGALTISYRRRIAELANKNRMPSMCERSDYVEAGCLMSYAADEAEIYKRLAIYVDKILKGANPADLPVEQPTKFEFVVNLKTAHQIDLTIPPNVLARADKVIR